MIYVGIDPGGSSGAFAAVDTEGFVILTQKFIDWKSTYNRALFAGDFSISEPAVAVRSQNIFTVLEHAQPMPKQGVTSMFSYGGNFGGWQSLLEGHGIPYQLVKPQKWMKAILGSFPTGQSKPRAYDYVRRRHPGLDVKKSSTGIIDAVCMAMYARFLQTGKL